MQPFGHRQTGFAQPNDQHPTTFKVCRGSVRGAQEVGHNDVVVDALTQLEGRKAEQYQHDGDDPEPYDDLRFFPATQFIVMV